MFEIYLGCDSFSASTVGTIADFFRCSRFSELMKLKCIAFYVDTCKRKLKKSLLNLCECHKLTLAKYILMKPQG